MPLVSIALCTYNGARYLPQQLDSLLAQTFTNIEIVAVDDGSTDGTIAILNDYASRHPNFKIVKNDENLGYIKNFERAINLCTGDFIALCDQDDIWLQNKIDVLMANIGDSMLIYHDSAFVDEHGKPLNKKVSDVRNFYAGTNANVFLLENCVSGHALMFKRPLLHFLNGFNKTIFHDWWLVYAACNNGGVTFVNQVLVQYRQHTAANTNILRQDRGQAITAAFAQRIEKQLAITEAFVNYPHNKDLPFKQTFLQLMQQRMHSYFSFGLAWLIFKNRETLLFIQKKPLLSKLNFAWKFAWGYKLKTLFK
jgi:glycosyltransferase involved in cell wall biosynthesis